MRRIWRRKFSGATVVYLFTRYTALIDRVLFVTEVLLWDSSDRVGMQGSKDVMKLLMTNDFLSDLWKDRT